MHQNSQPVELVSWKGWREEVPQEGQAVLARVAGDRVAADPQVVIQLEIPDACCLVAA